MFLFAYLQSLIYRAHAYLMRQASTVQFIIDCLMPPFLKDVLSILLENRKQALFFSPQANKNL